MSNYIHHGRVLDNKLATPRSSCGGRPYNARRKQRDTPHVTAAHIYIRRFLGASNYAPVRLLAWIRARAEEVRNSDKLNTRARTTIKNVYRTRAHVSGGILQHGHSTAEWEMVDDGGAVYNFFEINNANRNPPYINGALFETNATGGVIPSGKRTIFRSS